MSIEQPSEASACRFEFDFFARAQSPFSLWSAHCPPVRLLHSHCSYLDRSARCALLRCFESTRARLLARSFSPSAWRETPIESIVYSIVYSIVESILGLIKVPIPILSHTRVCRFKINSTNCDRSVLCPLPHVTSNHTCPPPSADEVQVGLTLAGHQGATRPDATQTLATLLAEARLCVAQAATMAQHQHHQQQQSMDENTMPTQDTAFEQLSQETKQIGWGRIVSTNPMFANANLVENYISIGRKSSCTLQIKHAAISGLHCSLTRQDASVVFIADHSTNGTYCDGTRIGKEQRRLLSNGSEITLIRNAEIKISFIVFLYEHETGSRKHLPTSQFALQQQQQQQQSQQRSGSKRNPASGTSSSIIAHNNSQLAAASQFDDESAPEAKYQMKEMLGTGAFAIVKVCVDRQTGQKYAMKIIEKRKFSLNQNTKRANALLDEIRILKTLNHNHIIKIHETFNTALHLYLVLELAGSDLFDLIVSFGGKGMGEQRSKHIFTQICDATLYLHSHSIVHRDIKVSWVESCCGLELMLTYSHSIADTPIVDRVVLITLPAGERAHGPQPGSRD